MKKMKEKEDQLIADIMKDFQAENPSEGFTARVMQSIETETSISDFYSRPLISRAGWVGIAAGILGIFLIFFLMPDNQAATEPGWLTQFISDLNLPTIDFSFSGLFSKLYLGSTTLYWIFIGVAGIGFLALIERILESVKPRQVYLI